MHTDSCGKICGQYHAKGSGKETKIQEISMEIQRMWNVTCMFLPVITIGATGMDGKWV
jgi:hypothetical protein